MPSLEKGEDQMDWSSANGHDGWIVGDETIFKGDFQEMTFYAKEKH
jgi:hypothetical protein